MKEAKLTAEMKVGMEKIRNSEALEINLRLSQTPEAGRYKQPPRPGPSYPGENSGAGKRGGDFQKNANVRVNSVTINVRTTPA